jgi:hypothetical protein
MNPCIRETLCAVILVLAACGKGGGSGGGDKTATIDLFGKKPVPPGEMTKVKAGMTEDDVKALFKDIKPTPNHSGATSLRVPSGYGNVDYDIVFYQDLKTVAHVDVSVPKDLAAKLETAWGPGKKSPMGTEWINEDDGYEVEVWEMGRKADIKFKPYTPVGPVYFGTKPAPFDVLAKVKLGMTRDEIGKAVPGLEKAGAPKGGGSFVPFTGKAGTFQDPVRIDVEFDDEDKARSYVVNLPSGGGEKLAKAWGPRPGKARGTGSPMNCWDLPDGTRFEQSDDRITFTTAANSVCEVAP